MHKRLAVVHDFQIFCWGKLQFGIFRETLCMERRQIWKAIGQRSLGLPLARMTLRNPDRTESSPLIREVPGSSWWRLSRAGQTGNVHSAEDWAEVLLPTIERQQKLGKEVVFRADAAFAKPEIYEALEQRGVKYTIRLPANDNLLRDIEELLTRPLGRPSHKPIVWYKGFFYRAANWKTARRVLAKVEFHAGEVWQEWAADGAISAVLVRGFVPKEAIRVKKCFTLTPAEIGGTMSPVCCGQKGDPSFNVLL